MDSKRDIRLIQSTNYASYCWNRRTCSAEKLAPWYPQAASFERMYQESLVVGFTDCPPEAA